MTPTEKNLRAELGLDVPGKGHKNYSVKAGAGGGKTTLLSHRIGNQIAHGTPIDEFVIITYTNAAAAELREKITVRLQDMINSGALTGAELSNVTAALNSIELMQISTIHAFLFKILREYSFEAGIVMDATVLETEEDDARKKSFFDKWYRGHFREIEAFKADWIYKSKTNGNKVDHCREVFENMFKDIANVRDEIVYDVSDHTADFEKAAEAYVKHWLGSLIIFKTEFLKNRPTKKDGTFKKINKDPETIINNISAVEGASSYGIAEALKLSEALVKMKNILDKGDSFYGAAGTNMPLMGVIPNYPKFELAWNFGKLHDDFWAKAQEASKVAEYVCTMQKEYQKEIDEETLALSNDDILYRAEKLLTSNPSVLDKLRDRYTKIYVDEFQDTTGLQTRIIKLLSEKKGATLSAIDFSEDKLLVVGDAKQSIYRFTGAEKVVYDETDQLMDSLPDAQAESVNLESNFRSNKDIVDWVNDSFHVLMPGYTPMGTDWVVKESAALHGIYRYDTQGAAWKRPEDVAGVVGLVQRLVGNPKYFVERPTRSSQGDITSFDLDEIQYSDIMIICKNTTHMDSYVEAFAREGIPVNVQGKFKIEDDEVLRNFVHLIEYFAGHKNKKKRITAAQILRGMDVAKVDESVISDAEDGLRSLIKQFRKAGMDTAAIVKQLLSHEEYFVPKGKAHEIERVRSYRIRLHQMVETCLSKNSGDLSELAELMNDYLTSEIKRENPLESHENAIRLMNAHQAKGLTGQIVIIADRSSNERCRYGGFRKNGKYYPAATFKHNQNGPAAPLTTPSFGHDMAIMKQVYTDECEEAVRLQYVAATRAAHALIIMPAVSDNVWFTDAAYKLELQKDICEWFDERDSDTKAYSVNSMGGGTSHSTVTLDNLAMNISAADVLKLSESQLTSITPSGLEPAGVTGYDPTDPKFVKEARPGTNVFGTVMHRVYELIFNRYASINAVSAADQEKAIERIINQAILEQSDEMRSSDNPDEFKSFLKPVMMDYLSKVVAPIVAGADEIYPEYTFSFFVPDCEKTKFLKDFDKYFKMGKDEIKVDSDKIWVNGQADLVVKRKDGTIKVYDYKSDAMNGKAMPAFEKSLAGKYEGQLALYKYAIGKAFGVTDVETELIHLYR